VVNYWKFSDFAICTSGTDLMGEYWNSQVEIKETGSTFEENALIKAQWVYDKSGLWALPMIPVWKSML
jgi:inosine/xanthosine triphosphate pyrophosphatase family protein